MIQLHKWYPFVFPKEYDVKAIAFEKRVERLEFEYQQALKAEEVRKAVEANKIERVSNDFVVDLYNKNARQNTIELEMFENRRRFQIFV